MPISENQIAIDGLLADLHRQALEIENRIRGVYLVKEKLEQLEWSKKKIAEIVEEDKDGNSD